MAQAREVRQVSQPSAPGRNERNCDLESRQRAEAGSSEARRHEEAVERGMIFNPELQERRRRFEKVEDELFVSWRERGRPGIRSDDRERVDHGGNLRSVLDRA